MASAPEAAQMPFIKNLASSDRKLRTESLTSLQTFLSSRRDLPAPDAIKLWTGLYYALWMTDRPKPQQALAADLASLLLELRPSCAAPWLRGFWTVLSAQWPHIEALRLDKFLLLVRRVFAAQVRWAKQRGYEGAEVDAMLGVLREVCFDVEEENKLALGLRLHVLDVWVDELEREGALPGEEDAEAEDAAAAKKFVERIGAMVEILRRSPPKAVRERAKDSYDDERLPWVEPKGASDQEENTAEGDSDDEDGWGGIAD